MNESAARLQTALDNGDAAEMMEAVRLNWRLWTIFHSELLDPQNATAEDVKNNILSLAHFIDKHTVDYIADPASEKIDVLIGINRQLAEEKSASAG